MIICKCFISIEFNRFVIGRSIFYRLLLYKLPIYLGIKSMLPCCSIFNRLHSNKVKMLNFNEIAYAQISIRQTKTNKNIEWMLLYAILAIQVIIYNM